MKRTVKTGVYTYNGAEETFAFYTTLRAIDKINFINAVTNILVGDNYYPVIRDIIFDFEQKFGGKMRKKFLLVQNSVFYYEAGPASEQDLKLWNA